MKRLNQNGAVAILTVVIFSLIVTIVVTAYARITVVEHQESINYDLSTRAYYAAETGVQDAIRDIRVNKDNLQNVGRPDDCRSADPDFGKLDGSSNLAYTCQLINVAPNSIASSTNTEQSVLFELIPKDNIDPSDDLDLKVLWSESGGSTTFYPRDDGSKLFPQTLGWMNGSGQIHPLLRVTVIRLLGKPVGRSRFTQNTFFLNPTQRAYADSTSEYFNFSTNTTPQSADSVIQNADCVTSAIPIEDKYSCRWSRKLKGSDITKSLPDPDEVANRIFLSFSSEYGATNIKFKLQKGGSDDIKDIELKDSQASIDVTARAGSIFRRVEQRVPLENNFSQISFGADALMVGKGICKHFTITASPADFSGCVTTP